MTVIDLVFEGGGAKGIVFVGALEELLRDDTNTPGRLLGTSAGAITATLLAAGYTPAEMAAALDERDAAGNPVFIGFLADPARPGRQALHDSTLRTLLGELKIPFIPQGAGARVEDFIVERLADHHLGRHLFSFFELGGWYGADPFVSWLTRKLNEGWYRGRPRGFGGLTLQEFFAQTGVELTLIAADTTAARMLLLNHVTAPHCPVVWAVRMSMSIPLLWQEVIWQAAWGPYCTWQSGTGWVAEQNVAGHAIVDGGILSNFPIALYLANTPDVAAIVGPPATDSVLGLLIDESLAMPGYAPAPPSGKTTTLQQWHIVTRLTHLVDTVTRGHDNMAIAAFGDHVVHLPAQGYGTTQFNMTAAERQTLVAGGRGAMQAFLAGRSHVAGFAAGFSLAPSEPTRSLANVAASAILAR